MFPNQRFGEVCLHNMHILFFYTHSPYFMYHCTEYKLIRAQGRISFCKKINSTLRHSSSYLQKY